MYKTIRGKSPGRFSDVKASSFDSDRISNGRIGSNDDEIKSAPPPLVDTIAGNLIFYYIYEIGGLRGAGGGGLLRSRSGHFVRLFILGPGFGRRGCYPKTSVYLLQIDYKRETVLKWTFAPIIPPPKNSPSGRQIRKSA